MGFEFRDFENYRNNISKLSDSFDAWLHGFMLTQGMRFMAGVKPRTPVDTGDLRNHWQLDGVTKEGESIHCWFVNSMYYATFVEYGHAKPYKSGATEGSADWVDGYFMVTITLDEVERNLPKQFEQSFTKFLMSLEVL